MRLRKPQILNLKGHMMNLQGDSLQKINSNYQQLKVKGLQYLWVKPRVLFSFSHYLPINPSLSETSNALPYQAQRSCPKVTYLIQST